MDQHARRQLIDKAIDVLEDGNRLLVVPMEEFFEGNTDEQSIGVNLPEGQHIGLGGYRKKLAEIESRDDVEAIYIELTRSS